MIDIQMESLVLLKDVPKMVETQSGRRLNLATVYRWKNRGLNGVHLETCYRYGQQHTSIEALARFDERVTVAKNGPSPTLPMSTPKQASQAHQRAKNKLTRAR